MFTDSLPTTVTSWKNESGEESACITFAFTSQHKLLGLRNVNVLLSLLSYGSRSVTSYCGGWHVLASSSSIRLASRSGVWLDLGNYRVDCQSCWERNMEMIAIGRIILLKSWCWSFVLCLAVHLFRERHKKNKRQEDMNDMRLPDYPHESPCNIGLWAHFLEGN